MESNVSRKTTSGKWVVLGLLALGVAAGLAGLKFRRFPAADPPAATRPVSPSPAAR